MQAEWTEWLENYKRQQVIKLEKAQNKIREESQRERDRQIELAIGRLEKETQDMKTVVRQSYESKLRYATVITLKKNTKIYIVWHNTYTMITTESISSTYVNIGYIQLCPHFLHGYRSMDAFEGRSKDVPSRSKDAVAFSANARDRTVTSKRRHRRYRCARYEYMFGSNKDKKDTIKVCIYNLPRVK